MKAERLEKVNSQSCVFIASCSMLLFKIAAIGKEDFSVDAGKLRVEILAEGSKSQKHVLALFERE